MPKTLDFNTLTRPTLQLIMQDEEHTKISVITPTEGLMEELGAALPELEKVLQNGDMTTVQACYDLAARLMSCNRSGIKVTTEDLRGKYQINLEALIIFYNAYIDFIEEVTNQKN